MKTFKKFISLFISSLLIFTALSSVSVSADTYREYNGFVFKYLSDNTAMISQYKGKSSTMIIPDTLLDHPVSSIEPNAFYEDSFIEHVVFGKNFTTISAFSFSNSTALKDITFPETLKLIVYAAFQGCSSLKFVDFANCNVNVVSEFSFNNCAVLSEVNLNSNVTKIEQMAFANNPSLQRIYIPSSVTSIAKDAFYNTPGVTIYCFSGSYALKYAVENNIDYFLIDSIDRSELEASLEIAEDISNNIIFYIPETVENLEKVYNQSFSVSKNFFATQDEVNNANVLLLNVIKNAQVSSFGDADLNGKINIRDVTAIQLYSANLRKFSYTQLLVADRSQDGEVDVKDATIIQLVLAGLL